MRCFADWSKRRHVTLSIIICSPLHGHPGWHYNVTPRDREAVTWHLLNANVRYILCRFCLRFVCFFDITVRIFVKYSSYDKTYDTQSFVGHGKRPRVTFQPWVVIFPCPTDYSGSSVKSLICRTETMWHCMSQLICCSQRWTLISVAEPTLTNHSNENLTLKILLCLCLSYRCGLRHYVFGLSIHLCVCVCKCIHAWIDG